ncbi:MAG TPA: DUF4190 domain-containing protein [Actinomycetes bacterium]|nr:DUF4190 domain-containing protein [Actinomycetes bacterium]
MTGIEPNNQSRAGTSVRDQPSHAVAADDELQHNRRDSDQTQRTNWRGRRRNRIDEKRVKPAKTSIAAVFALIVGLSAVYAVLTVLLSPVGLVLSLIGIALGIAGIRMTRQIGVTGRGVATSGLVLSVIALIGSIVLAAGVTTFLNDDAAVNRLENGVENMRQNLPQDVNIPQP